MAASTTHSVTAAGIVARLPFAPGNVTAATDALDTDTIDEWIDEAAAQLNALLQRHAIDPADIGGDTLSIVQSGIRAYTIARCLSHRNFPAERVEQQWETWNRVREMLRTEPQSLGDDQDATNQVVSNVDPNNATTTRFDADKDLF